MTPTITEAIERAARLAEPVPDDWSSWKNEDGIHGVRSDAMRHDVAVCSNEDGSAFHKIDGKNVYEPADVAAFIAAARTGWPAMADALRIAVEAIENASHTLFCPKHAVIPNDRECNCFKSRALTAIAARLKEGL